MRINFRRHHFTLSLAIIALVIAHLIWGANFVVAKIALQEIPPMTLAFLRYFLATLLLIPFLLTFEKKQLKVKLDHLPKLILVGIFMITINIALFYEGLKRTSAIDASVLSMSIPIISVIGGWFFLRERIFWINLIGIFLGFVGSLVLLGIPLIFIGKFSGVTLFGNILIILSSLSFVVGAVLAKSVLKKYHSVIVTTISFLVGAITFLIPALLEYVQNPSWVNNLSVLGVLSLIYITLLSSIVAFFLLNYGIEKIGVIKSNLFHYMEPAVAATFAVPFLGERISYSFIVGTVLIVLGVYWGTLGRPEHHYSRQKHHRS